VGRSLGGDDLFITPARFRAHRRTQRGAAVVEAALVISFVLIPLLVGVLTFGERLWRAQAVEPYNARVAPTQIVGHFTCAELVDRVKQTVVNNRAGRAQLGRRGGRRDRADRRRTRGCLHHGAAAQGER
jgi:hypothetical protein